MDSPGRGRSLPGYMPRGIQLRASSDKALGEHLVWLQDALVVQVGPKKGLRAFPEHQRVWLRDKGVQVT